MQKRGTLENEKLDDEWQLLGLASLVIVHRLGKNRGTEAPRQVTWEWEETHKECVSGEPDNGAVDLRQFGTAKIKV